MSSLLSPAPPSPEGGIDIPGEGATSRVHSTRGLRRVHLWAIVPLAVAWFAASIDSIEPFDFWWNVKSGQIMAQTGSFLGTDVLVWSPVREPYRNAQWLAQLLLYWAYDLSPYFLLTLRALIITATIGLILWLCLRRSGSLRVASLVALVAYFTAWTNYGMRPQLFAFLPFVAYLFLLEAKDDHPRWLPLLVPIMLFWVNIHGSFFLGVALVGIYALGTFLEKLWSAEGRGWLRSRAAGWQAIWLALAVAITIINPYLVDIYSYFFIATNDPIARSLNEEWQPPSIYGGTGILFFLNVVIFLVSVYISRRRLRATEILLVIAFGYLSLTSLRNVMWWGWATAPIMAANFGEWAAQRRASGARRTASGSEEQAAEGSSSEASVELPAVNLALAILLVGGALAVTPLWRPANPLLPPDSRGALASSTPAKLAAFLKQGQVPAPIFNYMEWGGYLEWELYPQYRMFIDGRFEARQVQVWDDYLSISSGRADWQGTLDRYGVRTLVLNRDFDSQLMPFVTSSPTWRKVYEDKAAVVFTRR